MSKTLKEIEKLKSLLLFYKNKPRSKTRIANIVKMIERLERKHEKEILTDKLHKLQVQVKEIKCKLISK